MTFPATAQSLFKANAALKQSLFNSPLFNGLGNMELVGSNLLPMIQGEFPGALTSCGLDASCISKHMATDSTSLYNNYYSPLFNTSSYPSLAIKFVKMGHSYENGSSVVVSVFGPHLWAPDQSVTVGRAMNDFILPFCNLVQAVNTYYNSCYGHLNPLSSYYPWFRNNEKSFQTFMTTFPLDPTAPFPQLTPTAFNNFTNALFDLFPWGYVGATNYSELFDAAYLIQYDPNYPNY